MIRECTDADLPWLCAEAKKTFAPFYPDYFEQGTALWFNACIHSNQHIVMRGDGVAGVAQIITTPWDPKHRICDLLHLFGRSPPHAKMEALNVVSSISDRRRQLQCGKFYISSSHRDLAPICKRLGGRLLGSLYVIED